MATATKPETAIRPGTAITPGTGTTPETIIRPGTAIQPKTVIKTKMSLPAMIYAVLDFMNKLQLVVPFLYSEKSHQLMWKSLQAASDRLKHKILELNNDARYKGWVSGHEAAARIFGLNGVAKAHEFLQQVMELLAHVGKKGEPASMGLEFFESTLEPPTYSDAHQVAPDRSDPDPGDPPLQFVDDGRSREYLRSIDFDDDSPLDGTFGGHTTSSTRQDTLPPVAFQQDMSTDDQKDAAIGRRYVRAVFKEYEALVQEIKDTIDAVIILLQPRLLQRPWPGVEN
jgi:hypothetical protein